MKSDLESQMHELWRLHNDARRGSRFAEVIYIEDALRDAISAWVEQMMQER